jgi:hypothetical protein
MKKLGLYILILTGIITACSKGSDSPAPVVTPEKAVLRLPAKDEVCLNGVSVSNTESTVRFEWTNANNAQSYELVIKNLLTNTLTNRVVNTNFIDINLLKDTPYSWYVISKSSKTSATAESDTWKFYNAGSGKTNYAPFPAEIVSPTYNQAVGSGNINLQWKGADTDNDITGYEVYFGTSETDVNNKSSSLSRTVAANLSSTAVTTNPGTTYYWKVITKDAKNNSSDSGLYKFRTN